MQLLANALIAGSFAALIASGLSLVYGVLGVFNMALGQFALIGGYITWWAYMDLHLPFAAAFLTGIAASALISWLSFEIFIAPYYRRHRFLPLVTTIALSMIIDGLLIIFFREEPHTIAVRSGVLHSFGSAIIAREQIMLIVITVIFLLLLAAFLEFTRYGRSVRATVQHSRAAESLGINADLLHRLVFIASGITAACAGVYVGIDQNLTPTLGFSITIKAYAALILAGKRSLGGTILCAYVIALLEQLAVGIPWFGWYIPAGYQAAVALVIIILILLLKPDGLFGSRLRSA